MFEWFKLDMDLLADMLEAEQKRLHKGLEFKPRPRIRYCNRPGWNTETREEWDARGEAAWQAYQRNRQETQERLETVDRLLRNMESRRVTPTFLNQDPPQYYERGRNR